jgi:voltage-gated potassium channel
VGRFLVCIGICIEGLYNIIMRQKRTLTILLFLTLILLIIGTLSFYTLGGEGIWESFYVTLTILLTHFYHKVDFPVGLQLVILLLIFGSFIIIAYVLKLAAEFLFEGQLSEGVKKRKMEKKVLKLTDHYIICGYGRVGKQVAQELSDEGVDFVVIDRNPVETYEADKEGYRIVEGDPIKEEVLQKAGIIKAKGLLACLGDDTDNLFLTLTAKSVHPDIYIVARASEEESVSKLEKAGADRVALPYQIGGYHMAAVALRPAVVDFLDVIVDGKHTELQIEEVNVERGSRLVGHKVSDVLSRKKTGATVLAINKRTGASKINPSGDEVLDRGDQLIIMGTRAQLELILKEFA